MSRQAAASTGFTLIELVMTVAIAAILMAIAVPSFSSARLSSQLRASTNDLIGTLNLARSEAIKRGGTVTVCASSDGQNCAGSWSQGWIVLHDASVLQSTGGVPGGFRITESSGVATLLFRSTGVDTTPATFTVCRSSPAGHQERVISVDATGRAAVRRTTTGSCP